jgi:hypothetical protein
MKRFFSLLNNNPDIALIILGILILIVGVFYE